MQVFKTIARQVQKSMRRGGLRETVKTALSFAREQLRRLAPRALRARRNEKLFDETLGVDTRGIVPLSALSVEGNTWIHGNRYQPIAAYLFEQMMSALPIDHRRFTFIDLGSGKGRALLLASRFPFRAIIGVEFADELHRTCLDNIRNFRQEWQQCRNIQAFRGDAAAFDFPLEPLVVYLYNPFGPEVLSAVLKRIERSLEADPRPVYVVYGQPDHAGVFEESERFGRMTSTGDYVIWSARLPAVSAPPA